jgi:hypothetical protein
MNFHPHSFISGNAAGLAGRLVALAGAALFLAQGSLPAAAQEKVFSGPQPGEKLTPFRVFDVTGPSRGKEVDYVTQFGGAPTVVVFVHALERSLVPLLNTVDQYGVEHKDALNTVIVFLTDDRVASEARLPQVAQSLRTQAPITISLDGPEGPGNYGLNKKCLMTIVVGKGNQVTANFALVQPGIADGPAVLKALSALAGDPKPPTAEELLERRRGTVQRPGRPAAARTERMPELDPAKLDVSTPEGLRAAFAALVAEIRTLRQEVAQLRGQAPAGTAPASERGSIPGAAPTDPKLLGLLRAFIQPSNDNATVDRVLREVEEYVKDDAGLRKQAVDGWVRVLFLKYGTEYAQKSGTPFVERLKK